jgi:hypothetical protein
MHGVFLTVLTSPQREQGILFRALKGQESLAGAAGW